MFSFAEQDWIRDPGPRSKNRWKHTRTGRIVYGAQNPGASKRGGSPAPADEAKTPKQPAAESPDRAKRFEEAHAKIKAMLDGERTPEAAKDLLNHLSGMTVDELTRIKKAYGLKASGKKAELAAKIGERLAAKKPEAKPAAAPKPEPQPAAAAAPAEKPAPTSSPSPLSTEEFRGELARAMKRVESRSSRPNFVSLVDLRKELPNISREDFDRHLYQLRRSGLYTTTGAEGRGGLKPEERDAGIVEDGVLQLFVSRRRDGDGGYPAENDHLRPAPKPAPAKPTPPPPAAATPAAKPAPKPTPKQETYDEGISTVRSLVKGVNEIRDQNKQDHGGSWSHSGELGRAIDKWKDAATKTIARLPVPAGWSADVERTAWSNYITFARRNDDGMPVDDDGDEDYEAIIKVRVSDHAAGSGRHHGENDLEFLLCGDAEDDKNPELDNAEGQMAAVFKSKFGIDWRLAAKKPEQQPAAAPKPAEMEPAAKPARSQEDQMRTWSDWKPKLSEARSPTADRERKRIMAMPLREDATQSLMTQMGAMPPGAAVSFTEAYRELSRKIPDITKDQFRRAVMEVQRTSQDVVRPFTRNPQEFFAAQGDIDLAVPNGDGFDYFLRAAPPPASPAPAEKPAPKPKTPDSPAAKPSTAPEK